MKYTITSNQDLSEAISKISMVDRKDKPWKLTFEKVKEKRSLRQNALYWMWIACICDESGYNKSNKIEKQLVHDRLRELLLPNKNKEILGMVKKELTSTTELSKEQMTNYMNGIKIHMITEYAIDLPLPEDKYYNQFIDKYQDYSR
jgi:hypothetical protein